MLSYQLKKLSRKVLKKVISFKFELIITFIYVLFNIYCIVYHIYLNGFNQFNFNLELIIYTLITCLCYVSFKAIRVELLVDLYKRLK
jgi:bacteriorhodopsin